MKSRIPRNQALPKEIAARLNDLAGAAKGKDWPSTEVSELVAYYHSLDIPWHVHGYVGGHTLYRFDLGWEADAADFISGMHRLARCVDFGQPLIGDCRCVGCHRRQTYLGQFFTWEEQKLAEANYGSMQCEREPRFDLE